MKWEKVKLGEIIESIINGPFGSQLHNSDYVDHGIPVVNPVNIVDHKITTDKIERVSEDKALELSRFVLNRNNIIVARKGDVSKCVIIEAEIGWICGSDCLRICLNESRISPKFLYYLLQNGECSTWLKSNATGSTMPGLNSRILSELPIVLPPRPLQNKIATILSNYDSLIAICRKQIALLEEAAQRLYREWFVNFRFPGHESAQIIDALPQDWTYGVVENLGKFVRGKNLLTTDAIPGNVPVIAGGLTPSCWHNTSNTSCPVITVSGSGANAGYTAIHNIPVWAADCSFLDTSQSDFLHYIYCFLKENSSLLKSKQKGSAQPHVYAKDINSCVLVIPENSILSTFENTVCKYFEEIGQFKSLITQIKDARDMLLPRLMSGEIDASEISEPVANCNQSVLANSYVPK